MWSRQLVTMAIYLYIVRHGEAESTAAEDQLRVLSEHGRWEAKRTALWLKTQLGQFKQVYASPFIRAQQTKDIIIERGPDSLDIDVMVDLIPEGNPKLAMDFVLANIDKNTADDINIMCVSHMPLVSYLIGEITGYTPILATAGVAKIKINLDKWNGVLETLIAPEQML